MGYLPKLLPCLFAPSLLLAAETVPQPFGISFDSTRQQLDKERQLLDCRQFNSGPLCRYAPVAGSMFAWYEVQFTAVENRIITVMGTSAAFPDHYQCQSRMLEINQLVRRQYGLQQAGSDPHTIVYEAPPISMLCTGDNSFHIIYRNPDLDPAEVEGEIRQAQAARPPNPYSDQF